MGGSTLGIFYLMGLLCYYCFYWNRELGARHVGGFFWVRCVHGRILVFRTGRRQDGESS